jgi:phospholipid-binding lipoprotein MlaA
MKNIIINQFSRCLMASALITLMVGCASQPEPEVQYTPPKRTFPELKDKPIDSRAILGVYDPFEKFNRSMYNFNAGFDRYVFLPVVSGYETVTPDIAQKGVTNFFSNLGEVPNFVNNVLQGEVSDSGVTLGRFVINTTVGVLGLWDPATKMGIYQRKEDFGQTLGKWGVGNGPYLVLPFLGPSNLRDTTGLAFDYTVENAIDVLNVNDDANKDGVRIGINTLEAIDARKNTKFRYYETGSPFEYSLVRYAYERMRQVQIEK